MCIFGCEGTGNPAMTARQSVLAVLFLSCSSLAASAAGDNAVLIAVSKVDLPPSLPGQCDVIGTVRQVLEGRTFRPGQAISIKVPCRGNDAYLIPAVAVLNGANIYFQPADILRKSHQGFARLDDSGVLIWKGPPKNFAPWGPAYGYRMMDGATLPAQ